MCGRNTDTTEASRLGLTGEVGWDPPPDPNDELGPERYRVSSPQWQRLVPQANPQPVVKEIPLEAMAQTQLYEAPQTVSDSSEVATPNSQDSARCFGQDDCYDLASDESDKDSGIREPDLNSLDSPLEENPLEVFLEWDDALESFRKWIRSIWARSSRRKHTLPWKPLWAWTGDVR